MQTPKEFVERYRDSWEQVMNGRSPVASMTEYFNVPCLMVGAEGTLSEYSTAESIQSFNQSRLDAFRAGGATKAKLRGCDVTTLGNHCALAVVRRWFRRARLAPLLQPAANARRVANSTFSVPGGVVMNECRPTLCCCGRAASAAPR